MALKVLILFELQYQSQSEMYMVINTELHMYLGQRHLGLASSSRHHPHYHKHLHHQQCEGLLALTPVNSTTAFQVWASESVFIDGECQRGSTLLQLIAEKIQNFVGSKIASLHSSLFPGITEMTVMCTQQLIKKVIMCHLCKFCAVFICQACHNTAYSVLTCSNKHGTYLIDFKTYNLHTTLFITGVVNSSSKTAS